VQAVIHAGAVAGAIAAITGVAILAWKGFIAAVESAIGSRIDRVVQQQFEQDADFNQALGEVALRLERIEECVGEVKAQVFPNSGSSLRDRVDALYELVLTS
jgi:hypothetical protein